MTKIDLEPQDDDDPVLVELVKKTINGFIESSSLNDFAAIKIKNWFDDKWTGFGGVHRDYSGLLSFEPGLPATYRDGRSLPPFSESRVVYLKTYGSPAKKPAGVFYFSGNSITNGRASLLASIPSTEGSWDWYVGYSNSPKWHAMRHKNISTKEIESWFKHDC